MTSLSLLAGRTVPPLCSVIQLGRIVFLTNLESLEHKTRTLYAVKQVKNLFKIWWTVGQRNLWNRKHGKSRFLYWRTTYKCTTRKHIDLFHINKRTGTRRDGHNICSRTKLIVSPTYVKKRHLALGSNASILKESPFLRKCINESKSLVLQYQCNTSLMFNFPMVGTKWYRYKHKLRID